MSIMVAVVTDQATGAMDPDATVIVDGVADVVAVVGRPTQLSTKNVSFRRTVSLWYVKVVTTPFML
jgi:hypothetical protein